MISWFRLRRPVPEEIPGLGTLYNGLYGTGRPPGVEKVVRVFTSSSAKKLKIDRKNFITVF